MAKSSITEIDLDGAKLALDEYGYVILPGLIPRGEASRMAERVIEIESRREAADGAGDELSSLFNHLEPSDYELFVPLITNPVVMALAQFKLGAGFQLIGADTKWTKPGTPASGTHADVPMGWFAAQGLPVPREICFLVQCNWMLTDFTRDNGATLLLPMSHRLGVPNMWPNEKGELTFMNDRVRDLRGELENGDPMGRLVAAEGEAGSAAVFLGAMWHRAGANVTANEHRVGILTPYHAQWADPGYGLGLKGSLLLRDVRDRMPEQVQKMSRNVVEDYPADWDYPD